MAMYHIMYFSFCSIVCKPCLIPSVVSYVAPHTEMVREKSPVSSYSTYYSSYSEGKLYIALKIEGWMENCSNSLCFLSIVTTVFGPTNAACEWLHWRFKPGSDIHFNVQTPLSINSKDHFKIHV